MLMMTSHILKSVDSTKTQKNLENKTFFPQIKKTLIIHQIKGYFIGKNSFVAEVTFKCSII